MTSHKYTVRTVCPEKRILVRTVLVVHVSKREKDLRWKERDGNRMTPQVYDI